VIFALSRQFTKQKICENI